MFLKIQYAPFKELHLVFWEYAGDSVNLKYYNTTIPLATPTIQSFTVRNRVKIDAIIKILKIQFLKHPYEYHKIVTEVSEKLYEMIKVIIDADLNQPEVGEAIRKFANGEINEDELKEKMLPYLIAINLKNK